MEKTYIERLEANIKINEDRIKSMQESYDSGIVYGRKSDLLCDITMKTIRLKEDKEELKKLKSEEIK